MPKPPILPVIDWKSVHNKGLDFEAWLAQAENPAQSAQIREDLGRLTLSPQEEAWLAALSRPVPVVAIAEAWCGDVLRHVPVLELLAQSAPLLQVRYIQCAQYPDLFARFLTNGGEAIPKFVFLSDAFVECANWGPMPTACRELIARGKGCGDLGAARKKVSALYAFDPECRIVTRELMACIDIAAATAP